MLDFIHTAQLLTRKIGGFFGKSLGANSRREVLTGA